MSLRRWGEMFYRCWEIFNSESIAVLFSSGFFVILAYMSVDFFYEKKLWRRGCRVIIGVDEVGVGPLAGPVTACAVTGLAKLSIINYRLSNLRDSKRLSPKQREKFFKIFCEDASMRWGLASVMPKTIDRVNIFQARRLAMKRAVEKLARKIGVTYSNDRDYMLLIDGNALLNTTMNQQAIVKGDEKVAIIGIASIIAKVTRDRAMLRYHKKYPEYRFDLHKGYGTKLHYEMLKEHGPCPIHRRSFRLV